MPQKLLARQFIKSPLKTAELLGNSKSMVRKLVDELNIENARMVVELGSGSGAITNEIADRLSSTATFLAFENNRDFAHKLRKMPRLQKVRVIEDNALNLDKYVEPEQVDCIISGLPLLNMRKSTVDAIMRKSYRCLKKNGMLVAYQLTLARRGTLEKYFSVNKIKWVWRNLPPYRIITCIKDRNDI